MAFVLVYPQTTLPRKKKSNQLFLLKGLCYSTACHMKSHRTNYYLSLWLIFHNLGIISLICFCLSFNSCLLISFLFFCSFIPHCFLLVTQLHRLCSNPFFTAAILWINCRVNKGDPSDAKVKSNTIEDLLLCPLAPWK